MSDHKSRRVLAALRRVASGLAVLGAMAMPVAAADTVRVGVFVASSAMPFYIGQERGYFAEAGLEIEPVLIGTHPLIIQSMVSGDIDVAANVVTLEGANINARRPGTLKFIAINGQNSEFIMEQFVVAPDSTATTIADLKGANLFSAPGPANLGAARASLLAAGLAETDFRLQEQGMGNHIGAMRSGNFDGGFTLEALASIMVDQGIARRLETGVIAKYLMGDESAEAYAAGAALSGTMLEERPDVAARFAEAWARAVEAANTDPSARELLSQMNVPDGLTDTVPLVNFTMVRDLSDEEMAEFQTFIDIGVDLGVVASPVAATDITEPL